ncbi:MAG: 18 kDa heat shock protein [Syntrophus sp. PtaU1.Bin005]|nr:MAG: 18 kDa heat shock protein [Syntrophus sp. PtaB.Bin138]OPY81507.1 MAG: 18 kDa heat shock protein [Syntrophus sp. PtaU1.Bin005]
MFGPGIWRMGRMLDMFPEMTRFQKDMNRFFSGLTQEYGQQHPPINVWISEDDVLVRAELPGMDPGAIEITTKGDLLYIKGSREPEPLEEGCRYHRQERGFGRFSRGLQLPFNVDQQKVEANYEKGILQIHLPRAEEDKPRKIAIKSE